MANNNSQNQKIFKIGGVSHLYHCVVSLDKNSVPIMVSLLPGTVYKTGLSNIDSECCAKDEVINIMVVLDTIKKYYRSYTNRRNVDC